MPKQQHTNKRKRINSPVAHKRPGLLVRLLQRLPGWAWWMGGLVVVSLYIYFFYYIFVSPFGFRWRALFGEVNYPEGYEIHGIDISHHQGTINWRVLREQGLIDKSPVRFVMIKATEGATRVDENFADNFYQAREYGFTRGAYHFYSVHSSAKAQAAFFISQVKLENGDLPPVLDVEHKPKQQSADEFKQSVLEWLHIVERHYGVKPIIYTFYKFKMQYLSDPVFDDYPYWIAHYYVDSVAYQGAWKFWQHTDVGKLPGIKGNVDFNIYNGSYYDLRKLTIGGIEQIGEDAYSY
ncbi:MAG: glycoside hydrolase family 25 protein [Prevotella sp.]|nr:glycoside hydrolase family 25 protein [Prevotella sp.]MBQ9204456.1 glycoside hydrolase family 25 protein [Prevotella sp.]